MPSGVGGDVQGGGPLLGFKGVDINTLESEQEGIQGHLDKVLPATFKRLLAPIPYWRYVRLPEDRRGGEHGKLIAGELSGADQIETGGT